MLLNKNQKKAVKIFEKVLPFFVFEMQSLNMFIKCTKMVLYRKGLISSDETRFDQDLSPTALSIFDRHYEKLIKIEREIDRS